MASKGKFSIHLSDAERIYWKRTLIKECGLQQPTAEQKERAWDRAQAIDKRHKRMKRALSRRRNRT